MRAVMALVAILMTTLSFGSDTKSEVPVPLKPAPTVLSPGMTSMGGIPLTADQMNRDQDSMSVGNHVVPQVKPDPLQTNTRIPGDSVAKTSVQPVQTSANEAAMGDEGASDRSGTSSKPLSFLSSSKPLTLYDMSLIDYDKQEYGKNGATTTQIGIKAVMDCADNALANPLEMRSVMDKEDMPPSNDKHDYMSYARYFHEDPNDKNARWVSEDGISNPMAVIGEPESIQHSDRTSWYYTYSNTNCLALAGYITEDTKYAQAGANYVRNWFLKSDTKMNPNNRYCQMIHNDKESNPSGVIDFLNMHIMLDSVRLLSKTPGGLSSEELQGVKDWVKSYAGYMKDAVHCKAERNRGNNHEVAYAIQVTALHAFTGSMEYISKLANEIIPKLSSQMGDQGSFPKEIERTRPAHYSVYTLQMWTTLGFMLKNVAGRDLFSEKADLFQKAFKFCTKQNLDKMADVNDAESDVYNRLLPLYYLGKAAGVDVDPLKSSVMEMAVDGYLNFHDDFAIPRFWNYIAAVPKSAINVMQVDDVNLQAPKEHKLGPKIPKKAGKVEFKVLEEAGKVKPKVSNKGRPKKAKANKASKIKLLQEASELQMHAAREYVAAFQQEQELKAKML